MIKVIIVSAFLSFAVIFSSHAQNGDRIGQLEKEIQELKARVSRLEPLLNEPSRAQGIDTSGERWKSLANWRKLSTDMSASEVRTILGEPERLDGGSVARWYYQNGGRVTFISGRVSQWVEPGK
jgi:ABC-type bacteriocin/lantibiotic exporter with double-glycine peptidase domain